MSVHANTRRSDGLLGYLGYEGIEDSTYLKGTVQKIRNTTEHQHLPETCPSYVETSAGVPFHLTGLRLAYDATPVSDDMLADAQAWRQGQIHDDPRADGDTEIDALHTAFPFYSDPAAIRVVNLFLGRRHFHKRLTIADHTSDDGGRFASEQRCTRETSRTLKGCLVNPRSS
ncbi:MAG TPA: hypothetical protein VF944_08395 [Candidatus Bathyarchaeia archaeon]